MDVEVIGDPNDLRIADYRGVRDPEWLRQRGIFLAEGRTTVRILARSERFELCSVLATETALRALEPDLGAETRVHLASRRVLEQASGFRFHQGCVAVGRQRVFPKPCDLTAGSPPGSIVVLDRLTNPDNVGSIFRSARAFGVAGVLASTDSVSPLYRKAVRTSMGAALLLPFAVASRVEILDAVLGAGMRAIALSPDARARPLRSIERDARPVALILGNEGDGLSTQARARAEGVRIEMVPGADSLNVATAAAIALYALCASTAREIG